MKSRNKRRVPWHITLFSGGAFVLVLSLLHGIDPGGVCAAAVMFGLGIFYIAWPLVRGKLKQDPEHGHDGP